MSGMRSLNGSLQDELIIPILPSVDALRNNQIFFQYYYNKTVTRLFYVEAYFDPSFDESVGDYLGTGMGGGLGTGTGPGDVLGTGTNTVPGIGAGFWEWDPTDTTTPDNGTTVVVDLVGHRYKLQGYGQLGLPSVGWVGTIAALRALPPPPNQIPVLVLGYAAIGDKPAVFYVFNPQDLSADDGGAVIKPNGSFGSGRWNIAT